MEQHYTKGKLVISDIWCKDKLSNNDEIKDMIETAIKTANMNICSYNEQVFEPYNGFTGVWILSESHFSVHTYPEFNYFSLDCYTCGDTAKPEEAIKYILNNSNVLKNTFEVIDRGML